MGADNASDLRTMAFLSIHLLGPFHVALDGESVTGFESDKVRALLAYLAVEADRPHSRDELAGLLWPDQPDRTARRNLSQALFNLRQTIHDEADSPFLQVTPRTVQFNLDSDHWLDVAAFTAHIATGEAQAHLRLETCEPCIQRLEQAVELYREFLAGFFVDDSVPFGEWATLQRERLHRQVLDALYYLAGHHEWHRDYERARRYAWRQVELEPWREEAHQQLMRLLVRSGQRSAALQQYETCRRILADELGVEPTETTRRLYRRIRAVSSIGAHNLPPQATPFVGRETELGEISRRLADPDCRLLTLVGPGGIGKTRLAIQAAYENRTTFLHGVCFVSLAPLQSAEFLASAIADALQLSSHGQVDPKEQLFYASQLSSRGQMGPKEQLLDALCEREMLLVLDNLEHLIEDGASLLVDILQAAPEAKLLVTSLERLNLQGEMVLGVEGLETPKEAEAEHAACYSAVDLFLQSARRAQADFALVNGGMSDVVRICRLVEGMPLGIELAASWVRLLSCQEIAAEIEQSLAFLSASTRDAPPRHRSVQAAFDHSWKRLAVEERHVFQRLAVFRGGFDRGAAAQVSGASLTTLSALIDKSFLNRTPSGRYSIHELMRQYAAEKLAQNPQEARKMQDDHCRYYARFVNDQFERFRAGQQREALDAVEAEVDNVRIAWQWAVDQGQYESIEQLMDGLYVFCYSRSLQEGHILFEKATAALEGAVAGQAQSEEEAIRLLGRLLWRQADLYRFYDTPTYENAIALLQRSIALLRPCHDKADLAESLRVLGLVLGFRERYAEARRSLEESIEIGRQLEDQTHLAWSLVRLGRVLAKMGGPARIEAKQLYQESLAIHRKYNDLTGIAFTLYCLGILAHALGDYAEAKRLFLESKDVYEQLGAPGWAARTISDLGKTYRHLGEDEAAIRCLCDALQRIVSTRQPIIYQFTLAEVARLFKKQGRYMRACELAAFLKHHPFTIHGIRDSASSLLADLEPKLPPEVAAAALARARKWTLDDVVAEVLAEVDG
jgi:predicted ATPase/DNA-binding SARP family transcriptional activator